MSGNKYGETLSDDERLLFRLLRSPRFRRRLGLPPAGEPLSIRQLAAVLSLSHQRIHQIEQQAFLKIREQLKELQQPTTSPNNHDSQ